MWRERNLAGPILGAQILGFQQEAAEAQARGAMAAYEQSVLIAFREVEDALGGRADSAHATRCSSGTGRGASVGAAPGKSSLKGGLANYLDVLIAQRNLFEAELALTSTHRLHLVSIVQLYKALGGGLAPGWGQATRAPADAKDERQVIDCRGKDEPDYSTASASRWRQRLGTAGEIDSRRFGPWDRPVRISRQKYLSLMVDPNDARINFDWVRLGRIPNRNVSEAPNGGVVQLILHPPGERS